ncbi:hypothetical protein PUN28_012273 [Cardiocondyla obscurior]|uniref:Uncharacterized protein n=1 Tax=Cardiocondyla obscurior TaxID=286306 RepID=A0AAW2FEQ6_9HYME
MQFRISINVIYNFIIRRQRLEKKKKKKEKERNYDKALRNIMEISLKVRAKILKAFKAARDTNSISFLLVRYLRESSQIGDFTSLFPHPPLLLPPRSSEGTSRRKRRAGSTDFKIAPAGLLTAPIVREENE